MTLRAAVACALVALLGLAGSACQDEETLTAPVLSATCEARPSSGPAPLAVAFLVGVSGAEGPFTVAVTYGDGTSGTSADAPHVYTVPGSFTASFTVATATQSARCATAVTVETGSTPPPGTNQPPDAVFKTTPDAAGSRISGTAPLGVRFNMCASTDPEGDRIFFTMDFDSDGAVDSAGTTGAHCRRDFVYAAGTWKARNCLYDLDAAGKALHDAQCKTWTLVVAP